MKKSFVLDKRMDREKTGYKKIYPPLLQRETVCNFRTYQDPHGVLGKVKAS